MWDLIVSVPDHCLSFYFAIVSIRYIKSLARNTWENEYKNRLENTSSLLYVKIFFCTLFICQLFVM